MQNVKREDAIDLCCNMHPPFYQVRRNDSEWEQKGGKVVRSIMVSREKNNDIS